MNWLTTFLQTSALCEMRQEKSRNCRIIRYSLLAKLYFTCGILRGEIFTHLPWGPPGLLYNGYRDFPGGKAAGTWR